MSDDIIVFTMHKSASTFLHTQCELLTKLSGIPYHSPNIGGSGLDARRLLTDKDIWRSNNGCFAPIRFFIDVPQIEKYQVILHLRDPRDVLVSMFYSYCYIHDGEIAGNTGYRKEVADKGIDAFVLDKVSEMSADYKGNYGTGTQLEKLIGNLPKRYTDYINELLRKPNVKFVKYEEMVTNYRSWLEKFIAPFPLDNKHAVIEQLAELEPTFFPKRTNDVMSHVRHITPGDHKAKLKQSTIEQLDDIFSDTLDALDYDKA